MVTMVGKVMVSMIRRRAKYRQGKGRNQAEGETEVGLFPRSQVGMMNFGFQRC
jgi:hypothetical protein